MHGAFISRKNCFPFPEHFLQPDYGFCDIPACLIQSVINRLPIKMPDEYPYTASKVCLLISYADGFLNIFRVREVHSPGIL